VNLREKEKGEKKAKKKGWHRQRKKKGSWKKGVIFMLEEGSDGRLQAAIFQGCPGEKNRRAKEKQRINRRSTKEKGRKKK